MTGAIDGTATIERRREDIQGARYREAAETSRRPVKETIRPAKAAAAR